MRSGGYAKSNNRRDLRLVSIIGLFLGGTAVGLASFGDAAVAEPHQFRNALRKSSPPGMGRSFAPLQRRTAAAPSAAARKTPLAGSTNAISPNGQFGKRPSGKFDLGKATPGEPALGKGRNGPVGKGPNGPLGKDQAARTATPGKGPAGPLGKGPNAPVGKGPGGPLGRSVQTGLPKGPIGQSGFGRSAFSKTAAERRTLILTHRSEILTSRLRLPYRPLPGERGFTGVPPRGETRFVPNELVLHVNPNVSPQVLDAAMQRHGLTTVESQRMDLTGGTLLRLRYGDSREMGDVVRALEGENIGVAQPDYVYSVQEDTTIAGKNGSSALDQNVDQYVVAKLRLDEAHRVATGSNVLVAVIDSKIDARHPDLAGAVADEFDAIGRRDPPDAHGTGMVGAIAAHRRLVGVAPGVRILAVRAFSPESGKAPQATTRHIIAGLEWAIKKGARVINMSFAGPYDPMLQLAMKNAHDKGVVLIAASGNLGPDSPPLYPAADPHVIAVTATDEHDQLFAQAVRGPHVAVAAPGVDIVVPAPNNHYQFTTGTSVAAAHVSGVAALLIEHHPDVDADTVLEVLTSSAKRLDPKGRDDMFGWGLIDPSNALAELDARMGGGQVAGPAKPAAPTPAAARQPASRPPAPRPASISVR